MRNYSRRAFSKTLIAAGAVAAFAPIQSRGANERIRLGFIGLGNRGDQVLDAFLTHPDCEVIAVCDIYQPYMDFASKKIGNQPRQFKDYRQLLEMKDIDAVVISTPDHWHALQMIHSCQAGKDVYVEKPLSLCVAEGRKMVEAAEKTQRVVQVGIHRRSIPVCAEAAQFIREGGIGKVTAVRAFHVQNEWPKGIGKPADTNPPADFDWEAWLGPAPKVPYNKNRTFYRFRWFYHYSGGQVTNFGVHYIDFIHWALGFDYPLAVAAMGGKFVIDDNREIPDTLEVIWQYPNNTLVTLSQFNATAAPPAARPAEIEFRGTKGTLYVQSSGYEVVPDTVTPNEFPPRNPANRELEKGYYKGAAPMIEAQKKTGASAGNTAFHARNFLDCVRSRQKPVCDILTGHRSTSATLIANIAHQTRALLEWDGKRERFTNHPTANDKLSYMYRPPYRLPG